jgi:hypothetical protein
MKDVTPKKGDDQKPAETKPAKAKAKNAVAVREAAKPPSAVAPMNMLAVLANAAADPKCEPAKMRELYAIHKEMAADQAKIDFIRDFAALQKENLHLNARGAIVIPAKGDRAGQNTPYAKFNDITKAIKPLLQKHGFTLSYETEPVPDGSRLIVKGILAHKGGYERTTAFPLPAEVSGSKNNVQGWGSSMSYGKRYCTIALLNITSEAMEEADTDGAHPAPKSLAGATSRQVIVADPQAPIEKPKRITVDQSTALVKIINEGVGLDKFLEKYKLKAVIDIDPALYDEAVKACTEYKTALARRASP